MGLYPHGWGVRLVMSWILAAGLALVSSISLAGQLDTGGQASVDTLGAAVYVVPLSVPPGTAGLEPKLSLNYNSRYGNDLLGMGWSLGGLSAVTRCPRTIAQDGAKGSVNYNANDRFCLDGQRLILVSGTYGADGAEYRTERDAFSKIVSSGNAGSGPARFKVWTKTGHLLEYGNTADSRIEVVAIAGSTPAWAAGTVRLWAQNKRSDTAGNYFTIAYTEDSSNGNFYPKRIDYTGNDTTTLAANNSVQFVYEAKPEVTTRYAPSSFTRDTVRLTAVNSYVGSALNGVYRLAYDNAGGSHRSRLQSVTQCDGAAKCLPPMLLVMKNGSTGIASSNNTVKTVTGNWKDPFTAYTGDFNGDGVTDLYLVGADADHFCPGPGIAASNNCVQTATGDWKGAFSINTGDFNGDGITDLYLIGNTASYFCVGPGIAASSANCVKTVSSDWRSAFATYAGDFNGDGMTDLLLVGMSTSYFCAGPGITMGNNCVQTATGNWKDTYAVYPADFSGDGITDVYLVGTTVSYFCSGPSIATTASCVPTVSDNWKDKYKVHTGDFNGDGTTDLYLVGTTNSYFCPGPDNTTRNNCVATVAANWKDTYAVYPGDFNGDDVTDLFLVGTTASYFCAGPGIASSNNCVQTVTGNWKDTYSIYPGDFNGDGATDLYLLGTANSSFAAGGGTQSDLLHTVSNSLGSLLTWSYAPLTSTVYTKAPVSAYPTQSLQWPMNVVSSIATANGIGGTLTTNYAYGGLKAEAGTGRGLLGFSSITSTQVETGLATRTDYRQDWPYVGLPSQVKTTQAGASGPGNQLNLVANAYGCLNPQTGSPCTVAVGNRYFPYVSQSVESAWDLNGAALPVVTSTNQFDSYGNPTQVTVGTNDGYSKTTTNTYQNDTAHWSIGRLLNSRIQSSTGAAAPVAAGSAPTLSLSRSPAPMIAGQSYTVTWSSTNATSVGYVCTASGSGLTGSATLAATGSSTGTANAAWIGYPSACTWTATGPGGTTTVAETATTLAAAVPDAPKTFNLVQTITGSGAYYNLRARAVAAGWNQSDVLIAHITVAAGVTVSSASTTTPAFTTGSGFPAGSKITVTNNGAIVGAGGAGGGTGSTGFPGGPAFQAAAAVTIYNNGVIGGGGGGGGSGGGSSFPPTYGGAGGRGQGPGAAVAGSNGTSESYSNGDSQGDSYAYGGRGGKGGNYGVAGATGNASSGAGSYGPSQPGKAGGAAGACTLGNANITWAVLGTRLGPLK